MDLAERISTLRQANGLSARQLAALVDVAPTTVTRIESGAVSPSFDLAQEILTVLGQPIGFTGAADRNAIAAARLAIDPSLPIDDSPAIDVWLQRWARIGLIGEFGLVAVGQRPNLLARAATSARLTRRAGAVDFMPNGSALAIAERLGLAGFGYALTGDAAANFYSASAGEVWPVVYVSDVSEAASVAGLVRREAGTFGARVTLIPFDGVSELGRTDIDGTTIAALDQVILDCFGGAGRMADQADILVGRRAA